MWSRLSGFQLLLPLRGSRERRVNAVSETLLMLISLGLKPLPHGPFAYAPISIAVLPMI
jgi:hypothetical protein